MSEKTEILFSSPALSELKREKLQKLCKIHAIKANGKNIELVDRLRLHAQTLPMDDPLSIAARSEPGSIAIATPQRTSEQWDMLDSIEEVEDALTGKCASGSTRTKGSAFKSLTMTLGLKATPSSSDIIDDDELAQHAIPYADVPPATPPINDNLTFNPTTSTLNRRPNTTSGDPLPGSVSRPGQPAPEDARLSLGLGLGVPSISSKQGQSTTTIRLVSKPLDQDQPTEENSHSIIPTSASLQKKAFQTPKLEPFATSYDIVMSPSAVRGSGSETLAFWVPEVKNIYPTLTIDDLPPDVPPSPFKLSNVSSDALDVPTTTITATLATTTTASNTKTEPFIFGSPLPQHSVSNTQFQAAATSVLEEMNKRLINSGVEGVGMDLVAKLQPGAHTEAQLREMKRLPSKSNIDSEKGGETRKKFDKLHEAEFEKMEGIDQMVKRREKKGSESVIGKKRKSSVLGELGDRNGRPRRPMGGKTSESTMVFSSGRRHNTLPGTFEDEEEGREQKRPRIEAEVDSDASALNVGDDDGNAQETKRQDRKVIKRKLEMSRAKRRSSAGGIIAAATKSATVKRNIGGSTARPVSPKSKPRVGFWGSAKSFVAGVWNRGGKGASPAKPKVATATSGVAAPGLNAPTKPSMMKHKDLAAPANRPPSTKPPSTAASMANSVNGPTIANQPAPATQPVAHVGVKSIPGSTRTKLPIPPAPIIQKASTVVGPNRVSRVQTMGSGMNNKTSRARAAPAAPSSLGVKSRIPSESGSGVEGFGKKIPVRSGSISAATGNVNENAGAAGTTMKTSTTTTSRLLAPTASSLARMRKVSTPPATAAISSNVTGVVGSKKDGAQSLGTITNSPVKRSRIRSPMSGKGGLGISSVFGAPGKRQIFSKPVVVTGASGIPIRAATATAVPVKKQEQDEEVEMADYTGVEATGDVADPGDGNDAKNTLGRQWSITRKPGIYREKVIAKLALQRATRSSSPSKTSSLGSGTNLAPPRTPLSGKIGGGGGLKTPRTGKRLRSSLGVRVRPGGRASYGGPTGGTGMLGGGGPGRELKVLNSAKKRVRQSEYARRRSRVSGVGVSGLGGGDDENQHKNE